MMLGKFVNLARRILCSGSRHIDEVSALYTLFKA